MNNVILNNWTDFKTRLSLKKAMHQYIDKGEIYLVWFVDGTCQYSVSLEKGGADATDFENNYLATANRSEQAVDSYGRRVVAADFIEGNRVTYVSHDFADKTTWYKNAVKIEAAAMTDSGDHLVYTSPDTHWINLSKITDRELAYEGMDPAVRRKIGYRLYGYTVYVNGVAAAENTYTVNFATGVVTFSSPRAAEDVVTASYYRAGSASYKLTAAPGQVLRIYRVEAQFSKNVNLSATNGLIFRINAGGVPQYEKTYFTIQDYLNTSNLGYGIPACGGLSNDVVVLPWDYNSYIDVIGNYGMDIEVTLEDDTTPMAGEIATAAFYTFVK